MLVFYAGSIHAAFDARFTIENYDKRAILITEKFAAEMYNMSRVCNICGKGQASGNNVSHSNRKTRRTFKANVQKVSYVEDGKEVKGYVCTRCLKKAERA